MKIYSGYSKNKTELRSTSSGGAASAISRAFIQNGGCVFGARYSKDFKSVEYCCVETEKDLELIKGSKYSKAKKGDIYNCVGNFLREGKLVLFIGLGCDVGAIKSFCNHQKIDTTNLYTIDILCHGPALSGVHESFIRELEKEYRSNICEFTTRYKKRGWGLFYIYAKFENGKKYFAPFDRSTYGIAFRTIAIPSCTCCKFKGEAHQGDLCVGDYWGIERDNPSWNKDGVSIMIVQTEYGQRMIDMLGDDFTVNLEKNNESVLKHNRMYIESRTQSSEYENFVHNMNEKGLSYAVSKLPKYKENIIRRIISRLNDMI